MNAAPALHHRALAAAWCLIGLAAAMLPGHAAQAATSVALSGRFGDEALLVIDGGAPRALSPGQSANGVTVISVGDQQATVELNGRRLQLRIGSAPVALGRVAGQRTVLIANAAGGFATEGSINGKPIRMVIDTGATLVSLSRQQAQHLGLSLDGGEPTRILTANGVIIGTRVTLSRVRVGSIELHDIAAVVSDSPMPFALLGMSFLRQVNMRHDGNELTLTPR